MHHECVAHDILIRVYERLGTDKPHRTEGLVVKEGKPEEATRPLSPTDAEETETQPMIDVRSGETNDSVHVQKPARKILHKTVTPTPNKPTPSRSVATASTKASAKKGHKKNTGHSQPYLGLFKATLRMQDGPIAWEIRDLRESVTGGDKAWTEEAHCPCGSSIDLGSI
ncbi:hypothetical protein IWW34DRAFT_903249 [Fusarium oxysporum f. sp. albedinis]|nr:hypothetical protein IWW34DRAFT_903249 [Fusarium oxysporum f. sp. albedinis]